MLPESFLLRFYLCFICVNLWLLMILLFGAAGYIGEAFVAELRRRAIDFEPVSRQQVDATRFVPLLEFLRKKKPEFVINVAGYTGKPNVDACEKDKAGTIIGNVLLPQTIAHACATLEIPWGHVSSGCIYSGAKIFENGTVRIEKDLTRPELVSLAEKNPAAIRGFIEDDQPNFSFRAEPCSFYSGSKALGEEAIFGVGRNYIWRLRIPFDEFDGTRNYLSKIQRYSKVYENVNSISHRGDFAKACLDLWERRAPFGTYNVTNPGFITTRQVVALVEKILKPGRAFEFWMDDKEFYLTAASAPRSNCVLDAGKLQAAGVKIRPVHQALQESLENWRPEKLSN